MTEETRNELTNILEWLYDKQDHLTEMIYEKPSDFYHGKMSACTDVSEFIETLMEKDKPKL